MATIISSSSLSNNPNLFSSLPSSKSQSQSQSYPLPIPLPLPKYPPKQRPPLIKGPLKPSPKKHPSFSKIPHNKTKYFKPISTNPPTTFPFPENPTDTRSILLGPSGLSFLLPGAPFEFKFSYSETPKASPLAIREPPFLPFAPPSMPRPWTGKAPLLSKKEKLLKKKKIPLFNTTHSRDFEGGKILELRKKNSGELFGGFVRDGRTRDEILGEELSAAEVKRFVAGFLRDNRQVNLGRDGLTHNMLELIHSHWKRQEVCKVKCKGVPTVDMDNVCRCIEEKTWGKIIHRSGGTIYLYRGRNYKYHLRPQYPVMLWKPATPVYPKLIQDAPEGLTKEEANVLRRKGKSLLAICKLAKNGMYDNLVNEVRQAFEGSILVKVDCRGLDPSDYKKIGAKLMELVPCVLLSFEEEQILMWRGREWKSMYPDRPIIFPSLTSSTYSDDSDKRSCTKEVRSSPRMMSLWQRAIESNKAVVLDQTDLGPDALLEKVEEFDALTQATEHSYPAILLRNEDRMSSSQSDGRVSENDEEFDNWSTDEEENELEDFGNEPFEQVEPPGPLGSLPVDLIASRLVSE